MTPFGRMVRQERKDRGMPIGEMADRLGVSTPYVSQLENGVKPVGGRVLDKIIALFELNESDAEALTRAAAHSRVAKPTSVTIELRKDADDYDRELASHLALSFNRLSPDAKRKIREMLKDQNNG